MQSNVLCRYYHLELVPQCEDYVGRLDIAS